jgi:hypothetical protein
MIKYKYRKQSQLVLESWYHINKTKHVKYACKILV